jgi:hypothetical protein
MKPPQFLIKSFTDKAHAENFCNGNIILRPQMYFEYFPKFGFELAHSGADTNPASPLFLFCAHKAPEDGVMLKDLPYYDKSKTFVRIENPYNLLKKINFILAPICLGTIKPIFKQVYYYEGKVPQNRPEMDSFCGYDQKDFEAIFFKPSGFSKEQRMCFFYDDFKFESHINSGDFKLIFKSHPAYEQSCSTLGPCSCFSSKRDLKEKSTCCYQIKYEGLEAYKSAQKSDSSQALFWVEVEFNVGAEIAKSFQVIDRV